MHIKLLLLFSVVWTTSLLGQTELDHQHSALDKEKTLEEVMSLGLLNSLPEQFLLRYTLPNENEITLSLTEQSGPEIPVYLVNDQQESRININSKSSFYQGFINGIDKGIVALNALDGQVELFFSAPNIGNVFIAKRLGGAIKTSFDHEMATPTSLEHCQNMDSIFFADRATNALRTSGQSSCKKVYISITTDDDLFNLKGRNITSVTDYVKALVNISSTIFRNEEISIGISEIKVRTTPFGLRHVTATDNLNIFRFVEPVFNGHIAVCLSGYRDEKGEASLGGAAITAGLCKRSYSYAFLNVQGQYKNYPDYSWDVFGVTHELGHVLGSPHTHACVWGPSQNKALDNCSPTEGGCAKGPQPIKGTIMSYCHTAGNPGINFSLGFGKEPGDLIRQGVASSSCVSDYIPDATMKSKPASITANISCKDGTFTHYYYDNGTTDDTDDVLMLSLALGANDIGNIYDGSLIVKSKYTNKAGSGSATQITASYIEPGDNFYVINKFWEVTTSKQPSTPVTVRFPFIQADLDELEGSVGHRIDLNKVVGFKIKSPGNPDPSTNHRNTSTKEYKEYKKGSIPSTTNWKYGTYGNMQFAEFKVNSFSGGGLGIHNTALPVELISFDATREGDAIRLSWETGQEINTEFFVIEKSDDGIHFFDYISLESKAHAADGAKYSELDYEPLKGVNYFRLRMVDYDEFYEYSNVALVNYDDPIHGFPQVTNTFLTNHILQLVNPEKEDMISVQIYNPLGQEIHFDIIECLGEEKVELGIPAFIPGVYLVRLSTNVGSMVQSIIIN